MTTLEILLREVRRDGSGAIRYQDAPVSVPQLTFGSRNDQALQLLGPSVAAEHGVIVGKGGAAEVRCRRGRTVLVDGKPVRKARLLPGTAAEIDGHRIRVIEPPAGFDLALEYQLDEKAQAAGYERAFVTDLERTWLGRRGPAWALLATVIVLTLAVPLWWVMDGEARMGGGGTIDGWVPDDRLWTSGPLHPAHELALGDDCGACHEVLFQRIRDEACTACHANLADHVAPDLASRIGAEPDRCATCHREHNEPARLVLAGDGLCTDCHAEPERFSPHMKLAAASGFSHERHPAFFVDLMQPVSREAGTGLEFHWVTARLPLEQAEDRSNLEFSHSVHLDPEKMRTQDSTLGCGSCHALEADGEHFAPVRMAEHCIDCHELRIDPNDPSRLLPHGRPREVVMTIEGYHLRQFTDPDRATPDVRRRLPDQRGRPPKPRPCDRPPFECAMEATERDAVSQFTHQGCVTCHRVETLDVPDLYSRFQVHPVRLTNDFYAAARFDHRSHLTHPDLEGDAVCGSCHAARTSSSSADVLMPGRDACVECHGDATVDDVVVLECGDCHDYHPHRGDTPVTPVRPTTAAAWQVSRLEEAGP